MMAPPIASPTTSNNFRASPPSSASPSYFAEGHDENNFRLQNDQQWTTTIVATRESARKPVGPSLASPVAVAATWQGSGSGAAPIANEQQHVASQEGWIAKNADAAEGLSQPHKCESSSPISRRVFPPTSMREPIAISNIMEQRHALSPHNNESSNAAITDSSRTDHLELLEVPQTLEAAMTQYVRRSRNSTEAGVIQDSAVTGTPPRHSMIARPGQTETPNDDSDQRMKNASYRASTIPRNPRDAINASPSLRTRQLPVHQQQVQQPQSQSRDSQSVNSQASGSGQLHPVAADWQWGVRSDPDDQEQALFEQRLCEDAYGVAVRKINQNGKSNLRYVKCCLLDLSEIEDANASSTRSVSSRSRISFSRLRGDRDRSLERSESGNYESHRNLLSKNQKKRVLVWGKKKDVKLPLDRFVCVRKGKTTDRSKRNTNPASRILSLITDDPRHPSLDIEAPTKLDRDKFARAFARFLDVPLEGEGQQNVRSADFPLHSPKGSYRLFLW